MKNIVIIISACLIVGGCQEKVANLDRDMQTVGNEEPVDSRYFGCVSFEMEKELGNIYFLNDDPSFELSLQKKVIFLEKFGIIADDYNENLYEPSFKDAMLRELSNILDIEVLKDSVETLEKQVFADNDLIMIRDSVYLWTDQRPEITSELPSDFFKIYRDSDITLDCTMSFPLSLYLNNEGKIDSIVYERNEYPDVMKKVKDKVDVLSFNPATYNGKSVGFRFDLQFGIYPSSQ